MLFHRPGRLDGLGLRPSTETMGRTLALGGGLAGRSFGDPRLDNPISGTEQTYCNAGAEPSFDLNRNAAYVAELPMGSRIRSKFPASASTLRPDRLLVLSSLN